VSYSSGGSISYVGSADGLTLAYTANGEPVRYEARIVRTPCRYGGCREWFLCPACARRCAVLYLVSRRFLCRRCNGLAYETQHRRPTWRLQLKAERIYERLGCNLYEGELTKPPRMHWRTFNRLAERAYDADERSWAIGLARFLPTT
jgi:hypothetical protein